MKIYKNCEKIISVWPAGPYHFIGRILRVRSDLKILVGNFNAKMEREGIVGPTIEKHSLHGKISDNGLRLVSFAAVENMVISTTKFQHHNIHKFKYKKGASRSILMGPSRGRKCTTSGPQKLCDGHVYVL